MDIRDEGFRCRTCGKVASMDADYGVWCDHCENSEVDCTCKPTKKGLE